MRFLSGAACRRQLWEKVASRGWAGGRGGCSGGGADHHEMRWLKGEAAEFSVIGVLNLLIGELKQLTCRVIIESYVLDAVILLFFFLLF
jgi:hypothetical protein